MKFGLSVVVLAASALAGTSFAQNAPAASPSASQSTTPAANTTPAPAAKPMKHGYDPNTVICKWTEEIGTRLGGGKTCMTRAQWDQETRDSQDGLADSVNRGAELGPTGH
jgi:hypothetical protein